VALKLGCIADDFGNARDLAVRLAAGGMRVVQTLGIPTTVVDEEADAVVVSLKSRYMRPRDAVFRAIDALVWLRAQGAERFYFCFSPTFNSRFTGEQRGNIGPVIEALMTALDTDFTVLVPASPSQGVTQAKGYLFVGDVLLNETGLESLPESPMTDANLVRVLRAQTSQKVALIDHVMVQDSSIAIQECLAGSRLSRVRMALVDASTDEDLERITDAAKNLPLLTGSAGLGLAWPQAFGMEPSAHATALPPREGFQAILCASCEDTSLRQVEQFHAAGLPAMALDPIKLSKFGPQKVAQAAMAWAGPLLAKGPVMLYSSASASSREAMGSLLGVANAGTLIEDCMAHIARGLVSLGVRQLVFGGTDTGIACLRGLGIRQLNIGEALDPMSSWCYGLMAPVMTAKAVDPGASPLSTAAPAAPPVGSGLHVVIKPGKRGVDDYFCRVFD
jgi:3-dehydrotetronate 4-kinase